MNGFWIMLGLIFLGFCLDRGLSPEKKAPLWLARILSKALHSNEL